jgi:UDP-N-acetylmuramoyl-L-alanyl-D-glutamate--2,6-diaminopimelate ligase
MAKIEIKNLPQNDKEVSRFMMELRPNFENILTIVITGTKGKTSTAEFIAQLFTYSGKKTALLTSETTQIGDKLYPPKSTSLDILFFLERCVRNGVECVVIELTSYAISQNFHRALDVDCAVLTNIGWDHIRAHGNRQNYVRMKIKLFKELTLRKEFKKAWAILNKDDPLYHQVRKAISNDVNIASYAIDSALHKEQSELSLKGDQISFRLKRTRFRLKGVPGAQHICETPLHGKFNVYNVLAAICCFVSLGGSAREAIKSAKMLKPPLGRFEIFQDSSPSSPILVIDYAHTPESLSNTLEAAKPLASKSRIIAVFGCGGDCYKGKRKIMGNIAAQMADEVIITTDNSRFEDPFKIAREIIRGVPPEHKDHCRIELDRAQAINMAIEMAMPGDVILIIGKGAEKYQQINNMKNLFSDREVAVTAMGRHFGIHLR